MLKKVWVLVLLGVLLGNVLFAQRTKSGGSYRSGDNDGAVLSGIAFSVGKITGPSEACSATAVRFDLTVAGTGVYRYEWVKMTEPSKVFADSAFLKIPSCQLSDKSKYYCKVTDRRTGASAFSDTLDFKVITQPVVQIRVSAEKIAKGASVTLTASGATDYLWSTGATTAEIVVSPGSTMTYYVKGSNGAICVDTKSKVIEVLKLEIETEGKVFLSSGMETVLTAKTIEGTTVTWYELDAPLQSRARTTGSGKTKVGTGPTLKVHPLVTTTYEAEVTFGEVKTSAYTTVYVKTKDSYRSGDQDGAEQSKIIFAPGKISGPAELCKEEETTLELRVSGTGVYSYEWRKRNGNSEVTVGTDTSCFLIKPAALSHTGEYYCKVTDIRSGAVAYSDTVPFTVKTYPTLKIEASAEKIAKGAPVTLTASGADVYQWNTGETTAVLTLTPEETTTYQVTGINGGLCRKSLSQKIEVIKLDVSLGPNLYISSGMNVTLTAQTNIDILKWYRIGETREQLPAFNDQKTMPVTPDATTTYEVEVEFGGYTSSAFVTVYVKDPKSYRGGDQDGAELSKIGFRVGNITGQQLICAKADAILEVAVSGTGVYVYEWTKLTPLETKVGIDSAALVIAAAAVSDSGSYYCKVTDLRSGDFHYSDTVRLQVKPYPVARIAAPQNDTIICAGSTVSLDARASELGNLLNDKYIYTWSGQGVTAKDTAVMDVTPDATTTYRLFLSNNGCVDTARIRIVVYKPVVDLPASVYVAEGATVSLQAEVDADAMSNPAATIEWWVEGKMWVRDVATRPFEWIVTKKDIVYAKMENHGCRAEDSCRLMMKLGGAYHSGDQDGYSQSCIRPHIFKQSPMNLDTCAIDSMTLYVLAEGSNLEYIWQKEVNYDFANLTATSGIRGLGTYQLKFSPLQLKDAGLYRCIIRNSCGTVISDTFAVSVDGKPTLSSRLNKVWPQCEGAPVVEMAVIAFTPNGEPKYQWYRNNKPIIGATGPGIKVDPLKKATSEGWYKVEVSNKCGIVADSMQMEVWEKARVKDYKTGIVTCEGSIVEFTMTTEGGGSYDIGLYEAEIIGGSVTAPVYTIKPVRVGNGNRVRFPVDMSYDQKAYVWIVSNDCGKDTSNLVRLSVDKKPQLDSWTPTPQVLCSGSPLRLSCTAASGGKPVNYKWYRNDVPYSTGSEINFNPISARDAGYYRCAISNEGCLEKVETPNIVVVVNEKPSISKTLNVHGNDRCVGRTLAISANSTGVHLYDSVRWYQNDRPLYDVPRHYSGANTLTLSIDSIAAGDNATYYMRAFNNCGSSQTDNYRLKVDFPAQFVTDLNGYTNLVLCYGEEQALSVQVTGTPDILYLWTRNGVKIAEGYNAVITLKDVTVDSTGDYCCEIHNHCTDMATRSCAKIKVSSPDTFRLAGNGLFCQNAAEGTELKLVGSDTNDVYRLYRDGSLLNTVAGNTIVPAGDTIVFPHLTLTGLYHVTATDTNNCTRKMPGEVRLETKPLPVEYTLYISKQFCEGGGEATLTLGGSQIGVTYQLFRYNSYQEPEIYRAPVTGTGAALNWADIKVGRYSVSAVNAAGCSAEMRNIINVEKKPLPKVYKLVALGSDSVYCSNKTSDVVLELQGFDAGNVYKLVKNGGDTIRPYCFTAPVRWTDKIDEGTYQVVVNNQAGCTAASNKQRVIKREPPLIQTLSGGETYCKDSTGTHLLRLGSSQVGVIYRFYRKSNASVVDMFRGTGNALTLEVPSVNETYYVVATDTTPDACENRMNGEAKVQRTDLAVMGNPEQLSVGYGSAAQLDVTVSGVVAPVAYSWTPTNLLNTLADAELKNPVTILLEKGNVMRVEVRDQSGCVEYGNVVININGGPVLAEIRDEGMMQPVDTVKICADETLSLYGWHDGGVSGPYQDRWIENGDTIATVVALNQYKKKGTGYLYFRSQRGNLSAVDSVWVQLRDSAEIYDLAEMGISCITPGDKPIRLSDSEAGVFYELEYSRLCNGTYVATAANINSPVGGEISLLVQNAESFYGCYRIRADKRTDGAVCSNYMNGVTELRPAPKVFNLRGNRTYCAGSVQEDTIVVYKNSELGVNYLLERMSTTDTVLIATKAGTGDSIVFAGKYSTGRYEVRGVTAYCSAKMNGEVHILEQALPADTVRLEGRGVYCSDLTPLTVSIPLPENGIKYSLYRDSADIITFIDILNGNPLVLSGTGLYYVEAENRATRCSRRLSDTVLINRSPGLFTLGGENAKYCTTEAGAPLSLKIYDKAESDVTYTLVNEKGETKAGWTFGSFYNDTVYYSGLLGRGDYQAKATLGGCSRLSDTKILVQSVDEPDDIQIKRINAACAHDSVAITSMYASQAGMTYILWRDNSGVVTQEAVKAGDNNPLNFGKQWKTGEYYVTVLGGEMESCGKRLSGTVTIHQSPQAVSLEGGAAYCAGEAGAVMEVKLYKVETGVTYELFRNSGEKIGVMGDRIVDSVYYRGTLTEGTYVAKATLGGCVRTTSDVVTILRNEIPRDVAVTGAGDYCPAADVQVTITINGPETGVEYTLYRDLYKGGVSTLLTLSGPGPLAFGQYIDQGIYYIVARRSNGCEFRLTGEVRIGDTPDVPHLSGTDQKYCAGGAGSEVSLKVWPVATGASYRLYQVGGGAVGTFANPVVDSLYFTGVLPAGAYTAKADLGNCSQVGKDTVHVTKVSAPQEILLTPVGEPCVFQPLAIGITSGEAGVSYRLSRDSASVITDMGTVTGTGALEWGKYSGIGKYYVTADNGVCTKVMALTTTLKQAPKAFTVTGAGAVCEGVAGTTVEVKAFPSEEKVTYRLYPVGGGSVVANLSRVGNVSSYNGILSVGRYVVKADFEGCILTSTTDTVTVTALRVDDRELLKPLTLCNGEGTLAMGVKSAQGNVTYELWQKGTPDVSLSSASGAGIDLTVGSATAAGIYYIRGRHTLCSTERNLPGQYEIGEKPLEYEITGETEFCVAAKGVSIGVSGTEAGVTYRLQRQDVQTLTFTDVTPPATIHPAASGGAEYFTALFGAGKYRVVAKKGCETVMRGELDVMSKAMPSDAVKIEVEGNPCVDSTLLITVATETGTDYTLWLDDVRTTHVALGGDGLSQQFIIDKASTGKYKIVADRDGCVVILPHTLEIGTPPFIDVLYADTAVCADKKALLYMNKYNTGVTYKLYSADTVVQARIVVRTNYEFLDILPGSYHVQASNGMCTANSNQVTVRSLVVPELPASIWDRSDCVTDGQGWIDLHQLSDTVVYRISSPALGGVDSVIRDYNGNKRLVGLPTGTYTMTVTHKVNGCRSNALTGIIRRGISEDDTITADRSYCENDPSGVYLRLNTYERNVQYTIRSKDGSYIYSTLTNGLVFPNRVTAGEYQFRRERTGLNGGCFLIDTIEVVTDTLPSRKVKIEVLGGPVLCAGSNYQVKILSSVAGVHYLLRDPNGVLVEAIDGTGSDLTFSKVINATGTYRLYLGNGKCEQAADTLITIHALPTKITVAGCDYCYDRNEGAGSKKCAVTLSGVRNGVAYILENAYALPLDTILRPLTAFAGQSDGTYTVMAEDTLTGCRAEMGTAQITGKIQPAVYTVGNGCSTSSTVATIDGSEVGVDYYLLRNGAVIGSSLPGTGSNLSFGIQNTPGVYKISGRKGSDCPVLMKDSVLIYNQLKKCDLVLVNELCEGPDNGVTLSYKCSVPGWNYYVTDGTANSDTLQGSRELLWSSVGKKLITAGEYHLVAFNNCSHSDLDTVEVKIQAKPLNQIVKGNGKYCNNTGFDIILGNSETGVTYRLELRVPKVSFPVVAGQDNQELKLNASPLIRSGIYDVYARKTGSQCEYLLTSKQMEPGTQPEFQNVLGDDVCVTAGGSEQLTLCLEKKEISRVDYSLVEKTSGLIKALLGSGATDLCFPPQSDYGVYKVVARHRESQCERTMTGEYAIGPKPNVYAVISTHDTVRLCAGIDTCIRITASDLGVNYQLYRNGTKIGVPVAGDKQGRSIIVGCVAESGVYKVLAYNKCEEWMTDSVIVKKIALPLLAINGTPYRYCDLKPGVTITVNATNPDDSYRLSMPDGSEAETWPGNADGSAISFLGEYFEGRYPLTVTSSVTHCSLTDTVVVDMDSLPKPFELQAIPGDYICVGSEGVNVVLSGSEKGLVYSLNEVNSPATVKEVTGDGSAVDFGKVKVPGSYIATTVYPWSSCKGESLYLLELKQADTVKRFEVTALQASYCYTNPASGSIKLSGSTVGVVYDLYCESKLMEGQSQNGTGGELTWTGLSGKACGSSKGDADGLVYTVRGRDMLSGCEDKMVGGARILEEEDPSVSYFHPNEALYICQDSFMNFAVIAKGCNLQYNWYQRDASNVTRLVQDAATLNDPLYKIDAAAAGDFGTYWCEISNSCPMTATTVKVAVSIRKTVIQHQPMEDVEICGDKSKLIALDAQIQNAQRYEWRKKGDDRLITTSELLWVSDTNDAEYICKASSQCNVIYDTCAVRHVVIPEITLVKGGSDTICQGTSYEMEVASNYPVQWFRNGEPLSLSGNRLYLPAVTTTDEGRYSVRVKNACDEVTLVVGDLYVDRPIELKKISPSNNPVTCVGSPITLFAETTPVDRVSYEWKYGLETKGYGPSLHIPQLADTNTRRTYTVYFRNKCREYNADGTAKDFAEVRIKLNPGIDFEDPPGQVIVCADPLRDTVLRIKHPATQIASYEWFYFNHLKDTVSMSSKADTIKISLSTSSNGYYYSRITNACGTVASHSCWFRVDSVPVVLTNFADDTLCEGSKLKIDVEATGGSLHYALIMKRKNGQIDTIDRDFETLYESTGEMESGLLSYADHDSSQVWCHLRNGCGESSTDTMLLRIRPWRELSVTPDSIKVCGNDTGRVELKLLNGTLPWKYKYQTPSGAEISVTDVTDAVSQMKVWETGTYRVSYVEDATGCARYHGLPTVVATSRGLSEAKISGGGDGCAGDTISVHISISGGKGPWQLWIEDELGGAGAVTNPLVMSGRDTSLVLTIMDTVHYFVDIIKDLSTGCIGISTDDRGIINAHVPDIIDFAMKGDAHVGQCRDLLLLDKLNPTLRSAGTVVAGNNFYLDGTKLSGVILTANRLKQLTGDRAIVCKYKDAAGCLVTSDEVSLFVDTLPSAVLTVAGHSCGNVLTKYKVELSGAPEFTLELERRILKYAKYNVGEDYRKWTPVMGVNDVIYNGEQMWTDADSCMILRVVSVTDRHDCYVTDQMPSDTVYHHLYPDLEIWTRYPNVEKSDWTKGMSPVYIARGDSVGVKATLTQGDRPWNLNCSPRGSIRGIHGVDTVFALDTGRYRITAGHDYCNVSASYGEELVVSYRDTGYLKMKVLLDGPFDVVSGEMQTAIEDKLPLYGIAALPDHSKVGNKKIIDWIEVELRTGNDVDSIAHMKRGSLLITRDTCLLWSDGTMTDRLGDTVMALPGAVIQGYNNYYVVVRHRNHLAVMSKKAYAVSRTRTGTIAKVDFTKEANVYRSARYGNMKTHMTYLVNGPRVYWALSAGDMNENALVSVFDPNDMNLRILKPTPDGIPGSSVVGYHPYDVNFDGEVDWPGWNQTGSSTLDWDKVRGNRYKFTEIRF